MYVVILFTDFTVSRNRDDLSICNTRDKQKSCYKKRYFKFTKKVHEIPGDTS